MKQYIENIYNEFLKEKANWCNIVESQFSNSKYGRYGNKQYSKKYIEQYYLLKYAPFYFEEYYEMYQDFFNIYDKKEINILSIGVGAGLDFWSLTDLIIDENININLDYIGVDLVDWYYRFDEIKFIQKSLSDLASIDLKNFSSGKLNAIVFPKSIIEIEQKYIIDFLRFIIKNNITDIWFLISFTKKENHISGQDKFEVIYDFLTQYGYKLSYGEIDNVKEGKEENKIFYPIDYKNSWLRDIKEYCQSKCNDFQINNCNLANQYPMLSKKYLAYGIYNFTR